MPAIIQKLRAVDRRYLPKNLPETLMTLLGHAKKLCECDYAQLEKIFLCYYLAISQSIDVKWNRVSECEKYSRLFIGAILSENFIALSDQRKYRIASTWNYAIEALHTDGLFKHDSLHLNVKLNTEDSKLISCEFSTITLSDTAIYTLKTWQAQNQNGDDINLPLTGIFITYGKEFTEEIYELCKYHLASSRTTLIPALKHLSEFINTTDHGMETEDFLNPRKSKEFWTNFKAWFFITERERKIKLRVIADIWKSFCRFANETLFNTSCFCIPNGGINQYCPTFTNLDEINTREINGQAYNFKLTKAIAIEISDSEAIEIIFKKLRNDIRAINRWAIRHAQSMKHKLRRMRKLQKISLSEEVTVKCVTSGTLNFEHLAIRAHMIYGHVTENDIRINSIFPRPLSEAADVIAAPTRDALLPLAYYLISQHPKITPSFLCNLVMFDKSNEVVGLIKTDTCTYLRGFKYRRGAHNAEQKIKLSKASLAIVNLIIEITKPARTYLKNNSDETWKKLFITTGKGFGYPRALTNLSYEAPRLTDVLIEIGEGREPRSSLEQINLSAKSIRATRAIMDFIKYKDLNSIAEALGHKQVSERLLKRYIPKPIFEFFSRRWIRIFQQALIIEAMAGSKFQLEAAGLNSATEIATFLESHSIEFMQPTDLPPQDKSHNLLLDANKEIIININADILELMLKISDTKTSHNEQSGLITYWQDISAAVLQRIDAPDFLRPDIKCLLEQARSRLTRH